MRTVITILLALCAAASLAAATLSAPAAAGSLVAVGGITILPAAPLGGDAVTIRLANEFGSIAQVLSASIARDGNTFRIDQHVSIVCLIGSSPVVASQFNVGQLPPGVYNVVATITFTDPSPMQPCSPPPIVQNATFVVAPSVPLFDARTLLLLGAALAAIAVVVLRA
ncbi:MAG TPA: hypothetical protein VF698_00800 [Thermoanaerobaculia bacterium]